jgi:hypothetical protein
MGTRQSDNVAINYQLRYFIIYEYDIAYLIYFTSFGIMCYWQI